ncbi:hypothetical protein [Clostridium frigidicarnis]|uniref:Uncharacterized protein n=1 Tax=Clostridium frigidicarnis TaxID=84698 RepID=A0A1I0VYF3_9CLOT|nr:hypothetical protein [Clostridium frigidicarnis]SFA80980.1 hypothetical protein SAMN04488528_1003101 [Clostridium frigidicarnis]
MKKSRKKLITLIMCGSIMATLLIPSMTAKADEAFQQELRNIINENFSKLEQNPKFSNYHQIQYAAERLSDPNEASKILGRLSQYSEKAYTDEVIGMLDKMSEFTKTKNMSLYNDLVYEDIPSMDDNENSEYLKGQLASWGSQLVFDYDKGYSAATDAIIKVGKLRNLGHYSEALIQGEISKEAIKNIATFKENGEYLIKNLNYEIQATEKRMNIDEDLPAVRFIRNNGGVLHISFNRHMNLDEIKNINNYTVQWPDKSEGNLDSNSYIKVISDKDIEIHSDLPESVLAILFNDNIKDTEGHNLVKEGAVAIPDYILDVMIEYQNEEGYLSDDAIVDDIDLEAIKNQLHRLNPETEMNDIIAYRSVCESVSYDILENWSQEYIGKRVGFTGVIKSVKDLGNNNIEATVNINDSSNVTRTRQICVHYTKFDGQTGLEPGESVMFYGIYKGKEANGNGGKTPSVKAKFFTSVAG